MDNLSDLFREQGYAKAFPKGVLDLISTRARAWVLPVNVHRSNVMWYNPTKLREWGVSAPKTWPEFLSTCAALKAKGLAAPLALNMYLTTFRANQFSKGAAIASVLLIMVAAIIVPYLSSQLRGARR